MKILAIIVMAVFYAAYFGKKWSQKRKGVSTNQIAVGDKPRKVMLVEKIMGLATVIIVPVELLSIVMHPRFTIITSLKNCITIQVIGVTVAALGVLTFITAMLTMADSWRAGIPEKDRTEFVQNGIYRISRNPAFLGFDLMYIGLLAAFPNILHLVFAVFPIAMLHLQILNEEKFCENVFGADYDEYRKKVRRYL